jgi:hypothetical protein
MTWATSTPSSSSTWQVGSAVQCRQCHPRTTFAATFQFPLSFWIAPLIPHSLPPAGNGIAGALPATWGSTARFQSLKYLHLADNLIESTLPAGWGARGVFPSLTSLDLSQNNLYGEIPASWSQRRSFPNLLTLDL